MSRKLLPQEFEETLARAGRPNAKKPRTSAHVPVLLNLWVAATGGFQPPTYRKSADGQVQLHGTITNGTNGTVAFILPAGFRPGEDGLLRFACAEAAMVDVEVDGSVRPLTYTSIVSLSGVSFPALG